MAHSYRVTHFPSEYMLGKTALNYKGWVNSKKIQLQVSFESD